MNESRDATQLLLGRSTAIREVRHAIEQVAVSDASVLVIGETGTGKELVAQSVHRQSARANNPFVPVNCGAIPSELLESELFGHEKGAFTGAISTRAGRFEMAEGGTLFLDEIGDMPLDMQVKLLRVLQEKSFERVGSTQTRKTDVRVIAATHQDLEILVSQNKFRMDLYYRLEVFPIKTPPLRERASDIELLVDHWLEKYPAGQRFQLEPAALASLMQCEWPGNVRELQNLTERLMILRPGQKVRALDLPEKYRHSDIEDHGGTFGQLEAQSLPDQGIDLKAHLASLEAEYIEEALARSGGTVSKAAAMLGMQRTTLVEKMKKLGIKS